MSLKDNIKTIKDELSTEEQLLESVIKAEGFWKKYKTIIIVLATVLVVGVLAKAIMGYMHDNNVESSNAAYNALMKDESDSVALATLKASNPKLYDMYQFKKSVASQDVATLEKTKAEVSDPILKNLLTYQAGSLNKKLTASEAGIAQELALFQEAYLLLQENKIKEAQAKFSQIPADSSLRGVVANLKHYMGQ